MIGTIFENKTILENPRYVTLHHGLLFSALHLTVTERAGGAPARRWGSCRPLVCALGTYLGAILLARKSVFLFPQKL